MVEHDIYDAVFFGIDARAFRALQSKNDERRTQPQNAADEATAIKENVENNPTRTLLRDRGLEGDRELDHIFFD